MSDKSDNKEVAKRVSRILRIIAKRIEENPELLADSELSLLEIPALKRNKKAEPPSITFDIFDIFAEGGAQALRNRLEPLELRALKRIIAKHSFDSSKLADKWRKKERLINLILERVTARTEKGEVFKGYP